MIGVVYEDNKVNTKIERSYSFQLYLRRMIFAGLGILLKN